MTDHVSVSLDATGLSSGLASASAEITRLARDEITPAALLIEEAFAGVAHSIERDLARAARSGSLSLRSLADSIVRDLKRVAISTFVEKPINAFLTNLLTAPFGGARAAGGFVAPGGSFLVGERGPELFTPSVSGRIGGAATRPIAVTITLPGVTDASSFRQSETQIAAGLARVIAKGQRNL
ncbi:MAG TPA: phage tail tape measure C-terminal domain-containing protein [Parvularculaceae bacterium]|nr:phage tail tape measure C-terminal domain-containing protein [Parvularculaceae bacterium]